MNCRILYFFVCTFELLNYVPSLLANPIVHSYPVTPDDKEFNYHVSIHHKTIGHSDYQYICGGSIIGETHILTAAHCYMKKDKNGIVSSVEPKRTKIIAGIKRRVGTGVERAIITVYIPIQFNTVKNELTGDIAVLRLADGLDISQHQTTMKIMPIFPLPPNAAINKENPKFCGFGQDIIDGPNLYGTSYLFADVLRYIRMKILGNRECPNFETTICATDSDPGPGSPCNGDAGGALIYDNHIVGVLSKEPPDCLYYRGPAVFTRIWAFTAFIARAQEDRVDHSVMHVLGENPSSHELSSRLRSRSPNHTHG